MKRLWVRETLYLLLPVLLVGGGVLLKKGDLLKWRNPLDPGPARMEIVGIKPLELTPLDVAHGYDWGTTIQKQNLGDANLPKNWKPSFSRSGPNMRFIYRKGKVWKPFPQPKREPYLGISVGTDQYSFKVNLEDVPKDADEVRMRGTLSESQYFTGPLPKGWTPPRNLTVVGAQRQLKLDSKPLDIAIKVPGQAMPAPHASHEQKIKLMDACWFTTKLTNGVTEEFFLHLRHSANQNWSSVGAHTIDNLHFFDGDGKELPIYQNNGKGPLSLGSSMQHSQDQFSPNMLGSDLIISLVPFDQAPRQPWSSCKQPIRIEAEVSDGICWPTKINTTFRHQSGEYENRIKLGEPLP